MVFCNTAPSRASAIRLTRHSIPCVVAMIRATGHDAPLFEQPDGMQFQDGELIEWGRYVVHSVDGFQVLDAVDFNETRADDAATDAETA